MQRIVFFMATMVEVKGIVRFDFSLLSWWNDNAFSWKRNILFRLRKEFETRGVASWDLPNDCHSVGRVAYPPILIARLHPALFRTPMSGQKSWLYDRFLVISFWRLFPKSGNSLIDGRGYRCAFLFAGLKVEAVLRILNSTLEMNLCILKVGNPAVYLYAVSQYESNCLDQSNLSPPLFLPIPIRSWASFGQANLKSSAFLIPL